MIAEPLRSEWGAPGGRDCGPSKRRFLVAARDLLDERGPTVTLSEIATRAGVDQSAVRRDLREVFLQLAASVTDPPPASQGPTQWLADLRRVLPARLADRTASLSEVSSALAISPRTLQRRLAAAGTSWRAEVDSARRELAGELARAGEARKAVARRLGYSDTRGLRRALRRWKGGA
jgi:AraC-like DNA-binding protein